MMELLKRFEESYPGEEDEEDEGEEEDVLVQRLKGVDLGTIELGSYSIPTFPTEAPLT